MQFELPAEFQQFFRLSGIVPQYDDYHQNYDFKFDDCNVIIDQSLDNVNFNMTFDYEGKMWDFDHYRLLVGEFGKGEFSVHITTCSKSKLAVVHMLCLMGVDSTKFESRFNCPITSHERIEWKRSAAHANAI